MGCGSGWSVYVGGMEERYGNEVVWFINKVWDGSLFDWVGWRYWWRN